MMHAIKAVCITPIFLEEALEGGGDTYGITVFTACTIFYLLYNLLYIIIVLPMSRAR